MFSENQKSEDEEFEQPALLEMNESLSSASDSDEELIDPRVAQFEMAEGADERQRNWRVRARKHKKDAKLTQQADKDLVLTRKAAALGVQAEVFKPTYHGRLHEQEMILSSLESFYRDHIIADVLSVVKGGKEATVYRCKAHAETGLNLLAGKIYRPRMFRNLKNDAMYRIGNQMRDSDGKVMRKEREQRAVAKRSKVGLEILHSSWLTNELNMLRTLHAAGVIVPKPLGSNDNAIVMEFLGDEVYAAPPLESVTLQKREAQRLFKLLVDNVLLMLKLGVVHGDLSAFNVLYWQGEVRIIDFPQALNVEKNPHAYKVFVRDVTRVCDYFARYDIRTYAAGLAKDLWSDALRISESELHEVQHARIEKAQWYAAQ